MWATWSGRHGEDLKNRIVALGLEATTLALVGKGLNHRQIAKDLQRQGHDVTHNQVYGFTSKLTVDQKAAVMQTNKEVAGAEIEDLEKIAARVLVKLERLVDQAMDGGPKKYLAITSMSNQLGQYIDRLIRIKAHAPDKITVQVNYVINNFQVALTTVQEVLLGDDDYAEAYAKIDALLKVRLGPHWGTIDLTQPTAVAELAPVPVPVVEEVQPIEEKKEKVRKDARTKRGQGPRKQAKGKPMGDKDHRQSPARKVQRMRGPHDDHA